MDDVKRIASLSEYVAKLCDNLGYDSTDRTAVLDRIWSYDLLFGTASYWDGNYVRSMLLDSNTPRPDDVEPDDWYLVSGTNEVAVNATNWWLWRESERFRTNVYTPVTFANALRTRVIMAEAKWWHFPHTSLSDPTMVAFTPSAAYGQQDRQVRMKVGKYLMRYYPQLGEGVIRDMANAAKPLVVQWADTAEEIGRVYRNGPSSCMGGDIEVDGLHAAEVYAGEFKLAYLEREGRIVARGLVHKPTNTWMRCYGDELLSLGRLLDDMGFERVRTWRGAHLQAIEVSRGRKWLMPYVDSGHNRDDQDYDGKYIDLVSKPGGGVWWELVGRRTKYNAGNTEGWLMKDGSHDDYDDEEDDRVQCWSCDEYYDPEDMTYSEHHGRDICVSCLNHHYTWAVTSRSGSRNHYAWVSNNDTVEIAGTAYLDNRDLLHDVGFEQCEYSDDWFPAGELVETQDGSRVHPEHTFWWYDADNAIHHSCFVRLPCSYEQLDQWRALVRCDGLGHTILALYPPGEVDDLSTVPRSASVPIEPKLLLEVLGDAPPVLSVFSGMVQTRLAQLRGQVLAVRAASEQREVA